MTPLFLVGTRKGLFSLGRGRSGWAAEAKAFLGIPVTALLRTEGGLIYVALNDGHFGPKLHRSNDRGTTWRECRAPAFPRSTDPENPVVQLIWSLEAERDDSRQLWAGTIPGGLFQSKDSGTTWSLVESLWARPERKEWFGGGYDDPGIHSICIDPRSDRRVAVAVSCGGVWYTSDGGLSWESRSRGMWANYVPPSRREDPAIQDPHRIVQCRSNPDVFWAQHHNGVFRSVDGLINWEDVSPPEAPFGFAVTVDPTDGNTAWLAPAQSDECRIPAGAHFRVLRTRDGGSRYEELETGLPAPSFDLVYRHGLEVNEGGQILALGSTTGGLWVSEDRGDSWECISAHLPPILCIRSFSS